MVSFGDAGSMPVGRDDRDLPMPETDGTEHQTGSGPKGTELSLIWGWVGQTDLRSQLGRREGYPP